jgi:hypothetical protein
MDRDLILQLMKQKVKIVSVAKEDYLKISAIRKMINCYISKNKMNQNLVINNIVILYNKYDVLLPEIFNLAFSKSQLEVLNPFLVFLGIINYADSMDYYIITNLKKFAEDNYIHDHFLKDC